MQTFTVRTQPVSINNRYIIDSRKGKPKLILSEEYRNAKEAVQWEIHSQFRGEIRTEDGLTVNILQYFSDNRRRDIDGYIKMILDAMTGVVYKDDSQIEELNVVKIKDHDEFLIQIQVL